MAPRRKADGAPGALPPAARKTATKPTAVRKAAPKDGINTEQAAAKDGSKTERQHRRSNQLADSFGAALEPFYYEKSLTDPIDTARDKWNLLPAFLKVKGLVKQHVDSFNHFVDVELRKIIDAEPLITSDIDPKFYIKYEDIYIGRPCRVDEMEESSLRRGGSTVTPNECRLRDFTYAAPILVDVRYAKGDASWRSTGLPIGRLPVMLRSNKCVLSNKSEAEMCAMDECPLDPGGYFIVNGTEKVILVQEQLSKNRIIVEADTKKDSIVASVTSSTHARKSKSYIVLKKDLLYMRHNILKEDVPVCILLKAMGVASDMDMMAIVAGPDSTLQEDFAINFEETIKAQIHTQQQALDYIGARLKISTKNTPFGQTRRNFVQEAVECVSAIFIAHVPVEDLNFRPKALYVAHMARRVLMAKRNPALVDDRDYVGNKRLELAGQLLSLLFEDLFKNYNYHIKTTIDKQLRKPNKTSVVEPAKIMAGASGHITQGMNRAIATGNWNLKRFRMDRAGVTHLLSRLSFIASLGMMTRISSQFEKTRKVSGPRALQPSSFGMLCPADTPEGEACGLVKNLALMTHITTDDEEAPIKRLIFMLGAEDITSVGGSELYAPGAYVVMLNGTPLATTRMPSHFLTSFRRLRRSGRISEFVSVFINHHHNTIQVATDEGRICRPLIIVEDKKSKVTKRYLKSLRQGSMDFDDFLARGLVEYLDVNEENDSHIAMYESDICSTTTHLEIEPFTILGAVAGLIPYPHHNQSPRNTYQCAMGKQAIGFIANNQFLRIDTLLYLMVYPQKPLVKTRTIELVKYDKLPAGQNATVAVMSYSGYDIEDALVLNKASVDRGFGRCQVLRKYPVSLKSYPNDTHDEVLAPSMRPDGTGPEKGHTLLDSDGIARVGEMVRAGEIMVNKAIPKNANSSLLSENGMDMGLEDQPQKYRLPDPSYIDKIMVTQAESSGHQIIKVQTRQTRVPEVGDKFSSRHGQKGVVGIIAEQVDMPFSDRGVTPDIIMNPHGFPSRMTVGKMLELVSGKAGILKGKFEYGTAFGGSKLEDMSKALLEAGYSYDGKDYLTSGITGEPLPAYVFTGPIYYQKLKHMVQDKMHSRSRGPRAILTRQPTEGRSRDGGLRLGEMERDCLIAYGASQLLRERLMLSSDKHDVDVCESCGFMAFGRWCQRCAKAGKAGSNVVRMTLPYAFKLLLNELGSMNVNTRLIVSDEFPADGSRRA
ncbi:DNA-directed RNA polymerase III subunit RPC2 [Cladophialophora yegresii CBS 114405]|uniref:DNA-directed RNA polymerase subunit beta n=1 Tax=Cladophialophora yegresii CBS 114405 TaxID=1182544 RepID=W9VYI1_9EURO|nr:DNA-directed RNA polymerase III subunit RPC2 [Cladophialophora yegresii CBS 114405]EXJ60748.1 DNA-directed RNA polymerase III subunit RPC2 [Cladophialophora yegresii CBS 114405]